MKPIVIRLATLLAAAFVFISDLAQAAGGKAEMLVVVADTRRVSWGPTVYFTDLYNTDPFMFGVVCTVITLILGVTLGALTDQIMKHTGIDLTSRKLIEH